MNTESNVAQFIKIAEPNEMAIVCDILASAFKDDPVMTWLSGHPKFFSINGAGS